MNRAENVLRRTAVGVPQPRLRLRHGVPYAYSCVAKAGAVLQHYSVDVFRSDCAIPGEYAEERRGDFFHPRHAAAL